jgi:SNF2 family DNA or RNA helicase
LSQIAGGFIIGDAGEVRLKENPKLKELALLLDEINEKCIIFHEYTEEAHMIEGLLTKRGLKFASLRAEIKDKTAEVVRFQTDPTCMVLVAHPQSGGAGLNLQMASVAIFYTSSYDGAVLRPQAEGRIWRDGQERSCLFIDILMAGSVDERKYAVRNTRADMAEVVLDYVKAKK